ncbi:hypothetical protein E0E54_02580 [Azotobacter chroococcum]|nr:hypothetical protein E0E54_02580 [Azotobacter chroococcum]
MPRNPKGRDPFGAARRRSSFIWNDQTSLLAPCSAPNGPPSQPTPKRQQTLGRRGVQQGGQQHAHAAPVRTLPVKTLAGIAGEKA